MSAVLEKIKKLIKLATNSGATEGERDNAMRMAHNLLAKHNLTEEDLSDEELRQIIELKSSYIINKWVRILGNSIAKLYFCKYYYSNGSIKKAHNFIGKTSNATTASMMTEYLVKSIRKEANGMSKTYNLDNAYITAFCMAAAVAIANRVQGIVEQSANEQITTGNGTSVVLASFYKTEEEQNAAYLSGQGVTTVTAKSKNVKYNRNGLSDGKAFGNTVSLNNQVGGNRQSILGIGN